MNKQKDWLIGIGIVVVTFILIILLANYVSRKQNYEGMSLTSGGDKVAIVELFGVISDARKYVRQFDQYGKNNSIKAIVLRIDSPGGGIAASQEIYEAVKRIRDGGKPVVASMGAVAASGGYYVACGTDTIMANPGTVTGSIGVITEFVNLEGLFEKIGVKFEVIKSGPFKDTGSPHRNLTSAERKYLQNFVDDAYQQFIGVVVEERQLSETKVRKLADGRIFTGNQASKNGLIDLLGDYKDAIELAAELGGIKGEPSLVKLRQRRSTLFDLLFEKAEYLLKGMHGGVFRYSLN